MNSELYKRDDALAEILKWRDHDLIKVVTGVRRCGKSTLLEQTRDALVASGVDSTRIAYINFEKREFQHLTTPDAVWKELDRRLTGTRRKYVLLDEVQRVEGFERLVDAIHADKQYDCYITGSNAWMLSGELATYLSGRYIELHLFPLSFAEFHDVAASHPLDSFLDYSRYGSFPYVRRILDEGRQDDVGQYLEGVFNTVLVKDVASRVKMSDVGTIRRIAFYLFDNVGNITNTKRISDVLSSAGTKVSYPSVSAYVEQLCRAYLFYKCERVDVKGLETLKTGVKYYTVDPGLRYWANGNRAGDSGRVLENIVFLELKRRYKNVFTGSAHNGREIDFVVRKGDEVAYYQVAETVKEVGTLERELRPLRELRDNYPKFLIVGEYGNPVMHDGIRQISAYDFLLKAGMS